jgi:hypothetical protein
MMVNFFTSCHKGIIIGNYQIVNQIIEIDDYESIELTTSARVIYRQISQDKPFLQVSVDDNILPSLEISVKGNRLIIGQKADSILQPTQFMIYTNSRNLKAVGLKGSGDIHLTNSLNAKSMDILLTGSGCVQADSLYCKNIEIKLTGSGNIQLQGAANSADFRITGSGDIEASDFLIEDSNCLISGSGDITLNVDKKLKATITGAGNIRYQGTPESVQTSVTGAGNIEKNN